jgi:hypothetical protein
VSDPKLRNQKLTLPIEKINLFSMERDQFDSVSARQNVRTIQLNENGMNEWVPQPSCMVEPMVNKTQSCNISTALYQNHVKISNIYDPNKSRPFELVGLFRVNQ